MLVVAVLLFSCKGESVAADGPITMQSEADKLILKNFLKHTESAVARITPETVAEIEEVESICWVWSKYLHMPLVAHKLTNDDRYIDSFVKGMDALLTRLREGPDGYLGFRGIPLPIFRDENDPTAEIDVDIAEFEVVRLICEFVEHVNNDEVLKRKYGDNASQYLELVENHLAGQKWESRELYVDVGTQGAVFRMPPECGNDRDNLTNPHNKQSKMCRAYLALYRVTGKDEYFRKAVKLGVRFKHTLTLDGGRYRWNYWDPAGDWDRTQNQSGEWKHWIGPEARGIYHGLTVAMAEALYDHGVVFDRSDMQQFVNTQVEVCWNRCFDEPEFYTTAGRPMGEPMIAPALARFDEKVWELCYGDDAAIELLERRDHEWGGGVLAIGYLTGKYLKPRTEEATRGRFRDRFTRNPENAAFLNELEGQIERGS